MKRRRITLFIICAMAFVVVGPAYAAKIGDLTSLNLAEQITRFFTLKDPSIRYAIIGSILLGLNCGVLGSFVVVRRMALVGDALSHAVLPGVAAGFLWTATKDPTAILIGAVIAGLLGTATINALTRFTSLKEDAAIGMVLSSFFALGITMLTIIQRMPVANKSGIHLFLFGQAAALTQSDIMLMFFVTVATLVIVFLFFKEFVTVSFDRHFAKSIGWPAEAIHHFMMFLLAATIVIALQAVGVVLVSAMLITPAAAAYLLTKRMRSMICVAAGIGIVSGVFGALLSFLNNNLPTGPFMVISASAVFALVLFVAPRHGVFMKWLKFRSLVRRTRMENVLKAIYRIRELKGFSVGVKYEEIADLRQQPLEETRKDVKELISNQLVSIDRNNNLILLKPEGWLKACSIVRNHRLWELYLNIEKNVPADKVHDEAEEIEHVLGEEIVRQLEKRLKQPHKDPHGRPIPSLADIWGGASPPKISSGTIGIYPKPW